MAGRPGTLSLIRCTRTRRCFAPPVRGTHRQGNRVRDCEQSDDDYRPDLSGTIQRLEALAPTGVQTKQDRAEITDRDVIAPAKCEPRARTSVFRRCMWPMSSRNARTRRQWPCHLPIRALRRSRTLARNRIGSYALTSASVTRNPSHTPIVLQNDSRFISPIRELRANVLILKIQPLAGPYRQIRPY